LRGPLSQLVPPTPYAVPYICLPFQSFKRTLRAHTQSDTDSLRHTLNSHTFTQTHTEFTQTHTEFTQIHSLAHQS
jgi:hypothetical protein